jgi:hypothetical protein
MKTLVALSGGPKSLVTAWLLKKQGMQVRGVHFDLFADDAHRDRVHEFEKRLGIPIQIIEGGGPLQGILEEEHQRCVQSGFEPDYRSVFFQKLLFPRLVQIRKDMGYDRIATGHAVHIQEDPSLKIGRIMIGGEFHFDSITSLMGISKEETHRLLAPVGSIPESMLNRLTEETAPRELTEIFERDWGALREFFMSKDPAPYKRVYQVIGSDGVLLGNLERAALRIGEGFIDTQGGENKSFRILDVRPAEGKVIVQPDAQIQSREFHFCEGIWFNRGDLGLEVLEVGMLWKGRTRPVAMRLMQFEGGAFKGMLQEPLVAGDSSVFKGDTVLWCDGSEILGGAKVLRIR